MNQHLFVVTKTYNDEVLQQWAHNLFFRQTYIVAAVDQANLIRQGQYQLTENYYCTSAMT